MAPDGRFVSAGKSEQQEELPYTLEEFSELHGIALDDPKITKAYDLYWEAWREEQSREDYFERLKREAWERGFAEGFVKSFIDGYVSVCGEIPRENHDKVLEHIAGALREKGINETVIAEAVKKVES